MGVPQVKDRPTRNTIKNIEDQFREVIGVLNRIVEIDPGKGIVRVSAGIMPRRVPRDPSKSATFGAVGEMVSWQDETTYRVYIKDGVSGEDTNWRELGAGEDGETIIIDDSQFIGEYENVTDLPGYPTPSAQFNHKWAWVRNPGGPSRDYICLENSDGVSYSWVPRASSLF